jgi:chemotaxis protein histidine kinase CheA
VNDEDLVRAKVAELSQGFLAKLPLRFGQMDAALAQCAADPGSEAGWQELRRVLHSLGGAAGTFGLPELGLAARDIERRLDLRLAAGGWTAQDVTSFDADVAVLRALAKV